MLLQLANLVKSLRKIREKPCEKIIKVPRPWIGLDPWLLLAILIHVAYASKILLNLLRKISEKLYEKLIKSLTPWIRLDGC